MGDRGFNPTPLAETLAPRRPQAPTPVPWHGRPGEPKPLWAILGEAPPYDWRPPNAEANQVMELAAKAELAGDASAPEAEPASERADQVGPGIYVTAHRIAGAGPIHTTIQYVPEDGKPEWISTGPDGGRLASGVGTLDEAGNPTGERSGDRPRNNAVVGRLTPPKGMTDAEYWERVKALDAAYRDNVDYDLDPEIQDGYNSNSYTRGILDASGGGATAPFDDYIGGRSPLPARNFAPRHLRGTGFEDSLKPQPSPPHFRRLPGTR